MTQVTYAVTEEKYSFGDKCRISYGIAAYSGAEEDGSATIIASIHDITTDKSGLVKLINDCNRLELSILHLRDVVEDFLLR